jgi:cyclin H
MGSTFIDHTTRSTHANTVVHSYIDYRFMDQKSMIETIKDDIADVLNRFKLVSTDEAKTIDRRLRFCANPAKNPESSMYVCLFLCIMTLINAY